MRLTVHRGRGDHDWEAAVYPEERAPHVHVPEGFRIQGLGFWGLGFGGLGVSHPFGSWGHVFSFVMSGVFRVAWGALQGFVQPLNPKP